MSYVDQVLFGDATGINAGCDTGRLARYFQALALNTARLADDKMLFAAAISRLTGLGYDCLLWDLLVVDTRPAWIHHIHRWTPVVRLPSG